MEPANDPFLKTVQHLSSAAQWDMLLRIALERLEQMPADDTAHRSAALALIRLRRGNKARLHVDYLLRDDPEHAFHHELAAQVAICEGKFLKAREHLAVGIQWDPEKVALHRLMISVQGMLGRPKEAQRYAQRVFELEGDCLRSWLMQEAAWEAEGQSPHTVRERIQALDQALKQDPEHSYLLWRVGRLLLKLEYPTAAQVWLARALTRDSSNPTYAADWRNSCERKFLVYRALVFPWAAWR